MNQEILRIFDILKMTAESKRIELRYQKEGDISVIINPDDFRQMMINLVDNAIKYTDEGGRVDVSVYENGAHFCILVEDTGCGIPEEDIPRIFERFYRVDKSRSKENGGTGLGLAIVKHIVQNNKGTIEVTSSVGIGTTFKAVSYTHLDVYKRQHLAIFFHSNCFHCFTPPYGVLIKNDDGRQGFKLTYARKAVPQILERNALSDQVFYNQTAVLQQCLGPAAVRNAAPVGAGHDLLLVVNGVDLGLGGAVWDNTAEMAEAPLLFKHPELSLIHI